MLSNSLRAALVTALTLCAPAAPVAADSLGSGLIGGIIGGVIVNEATKNKRKRVYRSNAYSAQRQANRETQTALNYFNFPAGTADGVIGSRTRAAVRQYQAYMEFPVTGELSQYQRDFLVSSHNRAQAGGQQVVKAMNSPKGVRGLLVAWHGDMTGTRSASYGGMPPEVSAAVDEIAASSDQSPEQLLQRPGFVHDSLANSGDLRNVTIAKQDAGGCHNAFQRATEFILHLMQHCGMLGVQRGSMCPFMRGVFRRRLCLLKSGG